MNIQGFMDRCSTAASGCVEWTGARNDKGYGRFHQGGRQIAAHRVAYELFVGPIPRGMTLDHLCRNRACVNPDHLEPTTIVENWRRGTGPEAFRLLAERRRLSDSCRRGHSMSPENTLIVSGKWRTCRICRRQSQLPKEQRSYV